MEDGTSRGWFCHYQSSIIVVNKAECRGLAVLSVINVIEVPSGLWQKPVW